MRAGARWLVALALSACASDPRAAPPLAPDGSMPAHDAATMDASGIDASAPAAGMDGGGGAGGDGGPAADAGVTDAGTSDAGALGAYDAGAATASSGGTITFQQIGAAGWYPSRRDPGSGACDAVQTDTCCMTRHEIAGDALTPWDEDLIMTLRGPMTLGQMAVYQPRSGAGGSWSRIADWELDPLAARGFSFAGDTMGGAAFGGTVGNQCLVDVASDREFPCGPGSVPFCPATAPDAPKHYGWSGSKLIVMLLSMPHAGDGTIPPGGDCGDDPANNWFDAPWIGFSHGELVRSGKFGDCHCYAKNPDEWFLGDGCGQLNAFEVVNDNNDAMNLDVFSTNFFGYQGYVGEGPCGGQCDVSGLGAGVDLIDKGTSAEAAAGAIATPSGGPGAAFVRPSSEPRYFIVLFDVASRTVQLAVISPARIPAGAAALLPALPAELPASAITALLELRLPQ